MLVEVEDIFYPHEASLAVLAPRLTRNLAITTYRLRNDSKESIDDSCGLERLKALSSGAPDARGKRHRVEVEQNG